MDSPSSSIDAPRFNKFTLFACTFWLNAAPVAVRCNSSKPHLATFNVNGSSTPVVLPHSHAHAHTRMQSYTTAAALLLRLPSTDQTSVPSLQHESGRRARSAKAVLIRGQKQPQTEHNKKKTTTTNEYVTQHHESRLTQLHAIACDCERHLVARQRLVVVMFCFFDLLFFIVPFVVNANRASVRALHILSLVVCKRCCHGHCFCDHACSPHSPLSWLPTLLSLLLLLRPGR